jgi:hypothetical protein
MSRRQARSLGWIAGLRQLLAWARGARPPVTSRLMAQIKPDNYDEFTAMQTFTNSTAATGAIGLEQAGGRRPSPAQRSGGPRVNHQGTDGRMSAARFPAGPGDSEIEKSARRCSLRIVSVRAPVPRARTISAPGVLSPARRPPRVIPVVREAWPVGAAIGPPLPGIGIAIARVVPAPAPAGSGPIKGGVSVRRPVRVGRPVGVERTRRLESRTLGLGRPCFGSRTVRSGEAGDHHGRCQWET